MYRLIKNRLRLALPPALFLAITCYFGWNAVHGKSGLAAQQLQRAALTKAQQEFMVVDADRSQWETRIADLNSQSIGQDMLDDQARLVLNLADPADLIVQLPEGPKNKQ